jgi:hypothetical protein
VSNGTDSNNALTRISQAVEKRGALVFANIENMETNVDLYRTEVTELSFKESDFHNISQKFMPNKAATDRIGEASGVQFIQSACKVFAETRDDPLCGKHTSFRAEAQGKVRMPDGSWRFSTVDEYEFDPVIRAMLDKNVTELTEAARKNIGRTILEYSKVARQRAATGARLRVIRQLTGMPQSFERADIAKPMVFTRIVQNTRYILTTPEGRAMATAQALGVDMSTLFGGRKMLDNASGEPQGKTDNEPPDDVPPADNTANLAAEAAADDEPDFPPDTGDDAQQKAATEFDRLTGTLEEYMSFKEYLDVTTKSGANPYKMAQDELASKTATVESRRKMINRLRDYLITKHTPGVV